MVAVPFDHPLQQPDVFFVDTHQPVFLHHEDSQAVAKGEQGRIHRVVAGADGIDAEGFELPDAPGVKGVRDGRPDAGMILMQVDAFDFQRFAIE